MAAADETQELPAKSKGLSLSKILLFFILPVFIVGATVAGLYFAGVFDGEEVQLTEEGSEGVTACIYPSRIGFPANCTSYLLPGYVAIFGHGSPYVASARMRWSDPRNRPTITRQLLLRCSTYGHPWPSRHRALPGNKYDAPFTRETYPRWV